METNCQKAIKDALKVLAVVKETKSPESEKELGERLVIGKRAATEATSTTEASSESGSQEESRPGRGGVSVQSKETSTSIGPPIDTQGDGGRVSTGSDRPSIHAGIHHTSIRENNTDESVGGDTGYVMLGETGGGHVMSDRVRENKLQRSSQLGEVDDGGSTGLIDENDSAGTLHGSLDHDFPGNQNEKKTKKNPMSAVSDDMEEQDVREALGAPPAVRPRRLTNLDHALASTPSTSTSRDGIKRGIDVSTTSSGQMKGSMLSHGVTQSVQGSGHYPEGRNAPVVNVQNSARSVPLIYPQIKNGQIIGISDSSGPTKRFYQSSEFSGFSSFDGSGRGSIADADSSVVSDSPIVLISEVIENQRLILDKLKLLDEIKHEVDGIKRVIMKHSLALSTIEGQLSSVMIAIPSSGAQGVNQDINPDLKPLLGRDRCRGINDVSKPRQQNISFDDTQVAKNQSVGNPRIKVELKSGIMPPDLDPTKTNATGFKPSNTVVTREIITALIDTRIKDKETNQKMKRLLAKAKNQRELCELHKAIIDALKRK